MNTKLRTLLYLSAMGLLLFAAGEILFNAGLIVLAGAFLLQLLFPQFELRFKQALSPSAAGVPEIKTMVERLGYEAGLEKIPEIRIIPSPQPNAAAYPGRDGNASIFVTTSLIQNLSPREVASVLAHELSHIKHNDLELFKTAQFLSQGSNILSRYAYLILFFLFPALMFINPLALLASLLLVFALPYASNMLLFALMRDREFLADQGAAEITGDPLGLAYALAKLEQPGIHRMQDPVFRSHPSTRERIRKLQEMEYVLGKSY
jgi:heat shock protein HtpX